MSSEEEVDLLDNIGFANGVRLHWSEVRQQHWLLFPEGAIALNANAIAILTLCNGDLSFNDLVTKLEKQFSNVKQSDIQDFLSQMMQRGLLINHHFHQNNESESVFVNLDEEEG